MLMTREMDYALRILRALHREEQLSAAEIAQRESIPKAITVKILKKLHTAGVVSGRRGSSGGYLLERSCEELYLWDLFQALGETVLVNRCQRSGYQCEARPEDGCGICRELTRIQAVLDRELRQTPLSAMF